MSAGQTSLSRHNVAFRLSLVRVDAVSPAAIAMVAEADKWLAEYERLVGGRAQIKGQEAHACDLAIKALRDNYPSMAALEREVYGVSIATEMSHGRRSGDVGNRDGLSDQVAAAKQDICR